MLQNVFNSSNKNYFIYVFHFVCCISFVYQQEAKYIKDTKAKNVQATKKSSICKIAVNINKTKTKLKSIPNKLGIRRIRKDNG